LSAVQAPVPKGDGETWYRKPKKHEAPHAPLSIRKLGSASPSSSSGWLTLCWITSGSSSLSTPPLWLPTIV
jgi:hypothetical protein